MTDMYITSLDEFNALKAEGKTLVIDFTATWCPPCKRIGPIYEGLVASYPELVMKKVDVDACAEVSASVGIRCMPTFMVFKNGAEVDKMEGASDEGLKAMLDKAKAAC